MSLVFRTLDATLKETEQKYKQDIKQLNSLLADTQERLKGIILLDLSIQSNYFWTHILTHDDPFKMDTFDV